MLEDLKQQSNLEYYKNSSVNTNNFLKTHTNPSRSINKIIDSEKFKQIIQNRKNINPIIEAITLHGSRNLELRERHKLKLIIQKFQMKTIRVISVKFYDTDFKTMLK